MALTVLSKYVSPRHGYEVVNTRGDLTIGLLPPAGAPPVEWRVSDRPVAYETALAAMTARAEAIARGEAAELVWLLEHPALYTAGTSARPDELIEARFPVHTAGRGGQFTYHGPGQRVGYVMLDLKRRAPDVRRFVATIEEWIIRTLAAFNVRGERRDDRVGVWVRRPDKGDGFEDKIAAIGIRVRQWVTLHGFALNVEPDLSHFSGIVPCGVADRATASPRSPISALTVSMPEVDMALRAAFEPLFGATPTLRRCRAPRTIRRAGAAPLRPGRPRADRRHRRARRAARRGTPRSWLRRRLPVPTNSASTEPSRRLRTQPCRPRSSAVTSVQAR